MTTASLPPLALGPHDTTAPTSDASSPARTRWLEAIPFVLCHLAALGALGSGVTWTAVALGVGLYWLRMFAVTAGYHRYFAHRAFETSRPFAFVLAFLAESTGQKGVIWWAARHRHHHLYSDTERDVHSASRHGFFHAHVGWLFSGTGETDLARVRDLTQRPELVWLDRHYLVPPIVVALACLAIGGWPGLFVGFFASTVCTWHATFAINSLAHTWGTRRYATRDTSRNNLWLALLTMGEGWHNNHHHYMRSARQGFFPGEIDLTYLALRALAKIGVVWGIKEVPARVLAEGRAADAARAGIGADRATGARAAW
jgi:stearoyl-CoA desaturase (delta-9 desaturase)